MSEIYAFPINELDKTDFIQDPGGMKFSDFMPQIEKVVVQSLITSFGLDAILKHCYDIDKAGGDVDTIINVRGEDGYFRNLDNLKNYMERGDYNSNAYHSHPEYKRINALYSEEQDKGILVDIYTGKIVDYKERTDLDHIISAKEIHDDPARILQEQNGPDLANTEINLGRTTYRINRSKKALSVEEFVESKLPERMARLSELRSKDNLSESEIRELNKLEDISAIDVRRMRAADAKARIEYNAKIANEYYKSSKFLHDTAKASLKKGFQMGIREALGFILAEFWMNIRERLPKINKKQKDKSTFNIILKEMHSATKDTWMDIKEKYKEIICSFGEGLLAGILASLSSTIINIFFKTAKMAGKILRETWSSIVKAVKILFVNPDNFRLGDQLKEVTKILALGVSVVIGSLVTESLSKIVTVPVINEILPTFCGSMVSGLATIAILYYLDNSDTIKKLTAYLNEIRSGFEICAENIIQIEYRITQYVAQLNNYDLDTFRNDIIAFDQESSKLLNIKDSFILNQELKKSIDILNIKLPYDDLENIMMNPNATLII